MEIAFHEAGLNYSGGDHRVLKKLLRTLMILYAYHSADARFSIYFVSPKVNPAVQKDLERIFTNLRKEYPLVEWYLLTNRNFVEQMMNPTLAKTSTVADTSELFVRAAKLLELGAGALSAKEPRQASSSQPAEDTTHARRDDPARSAGQAQIQPLVKDLMRTLLVKCPTLLDDQDKRNLMDQDYCKDGLGLRIGNRALLRRVEDGRKIAGYNRYYADVYGQFYVCSEWWRDDHVHNAKILLKLVTDLATRRAGHPNAARLERHRKALHDYLG